VIYLDTSALLAQLLAEERRPPPAVWREPLIASRLLEYEVWTRLHARGLEAQHGRAVEEFLTRVALVELSPLVLRRALQPFPLPVRTLDALHLASIDFLIQRRLDVRLATYDRRLAAAAAAMAVPIYDLA
jgi:predicted nucleic acid-binding protein